MFTTPLISSLKLLVVDSRPCQSVPIQHVIMFVLYYEWSLGRWFPSVTYVSSANKIDRHDKPQVLLKVALNTQHSTHICLMFVCLMVFSAIFNNISVIWWRSVLLVEETRVPGENYRHVASLRIRCD